MAPSVQPVGGYGNAPRHDHAPPGPAAFVVSPDEVLAKRAALLAEADDFRKFLDNIRDQLRMEPCGSDPVSIDVAEAVTERLVGSGDSYYNVCEQWVLNLYQTAEALADVARQYGYTDEDIAASLNRGAQRA